MKLLLKIRNFIKSFLFHVYAGFPKSTQQEINYRYNICADCESFDKEEHQCLECGCNVNNKKIFMNKLAWADQKCPLGKWDKTC
jgi:rRNA maturation endonuclease Nob1